jgi:hypothetical protein
VKCEAAHTHSRLAHLKIRQSGTRTGTGTNRVTGGEHGTETKTSQVRICGRDGVDHPSGHDVGFGSAGLVTDLPPSTFAFVLSDMREHVLLFCLLGLVLTATIILVAAPRAVTWALALIE